MIESNFLRCHKFSDFIVYGSQNLGKTWIYGQFCLVRLNENSIFAHLYINNVIRKTCILVLVAWTVLMGLGSCGQGLGVEQGKVDSLNILAYKMKYASLEQARQYADEAQDLAERIGYRDGISEAMLNRGDVHGMRMDYDSAQMCYLEVLEKSSNELMCGIADVDMMSVCLMLSMNKEFYDYRSEAQERLANVAEAVGDMTEHQRRLWNAVRTEYHFVSLNYFIKMRQEEGVEEELEWLEKSRDLFDEDTTQVSAFLFLKSFYGMKEGNPEDAVDEMQRSLIRLLSMNKQKGYVYFEASALNSLAKSVMSGGEMKPSRRVFLGELIGENSDENLSYQLASRSLQLARQYGNAFVETTALLTLSDYYLEKNEDSLALVQMKEALDLVNEHHQRVNKGKGAGLLQMEENVASGDSLSLEMRWIADPAVIAVPEWMANVREQLSGIYGAMGWKAASDYNHNIYFDILDATRQDLRVEQEEEHLMAEERTLNVLLWVFAVAIVLLVWVLILYNRKSHQEYHKKVEMLSQVIEVCRHLSSALTADIEDEEDLERALHDTADEDVARLFPQFEGQDWTKADVATLKGLDRELFRVLLVFYNWMKQKGMQYVNFAEERRRLESETYLYEKRLEENKRQYIEKLTSMSIVNGITPFLDRALHEVSKLKEGRSSDERTVRERFLYLSELIDKMNEYNYVLGHWVKIRQGMVTLNIESFALQPLFDTLKHGVKSFDIKGVSLQVDDTQSVVKADKSLTLFMMNTLLDNARKYTPSGGRVALSAAETEQYVEISVMDTGHGMSAEDVETINNSKVYDSSRIGATGAHAADIREQKGFGFGLMNCRGIIGKYKKTNAMFSVCEFGVESQVGQGSRFFFRLPKGVLKTVMTLGLFLLSVATGWALPLERAASYADSLYAANVGGRYERAILYADSAIQCLNDHYQAAHPKGKDLMQLEGEGMAELAWWKSGFDTDYQLIISIRNEVAIAALVLNRNALYHYNSEVFTRLYKLTSTDPTLEEYCNDIRMANRNKKTIVILLGVLILMVLVSYFFLHYRRHQLFIFNLRQFIQLNNNVFTSSEEQLPKVFHQSLSDIKAADMVGMMIRSWNEGKGERSFFTGNVEERDVYESLMRAVYRQKRVVTSGNGHFRAYPLFVPGSKEKVLTGVMGVRFSDGELTAEEELILDLVAQFMSIHSYFSYLKVDEMDEMLELKQDERMRIENEQQKVYVRNQIMDNCLSTLKHETMYYPTRIKQMVDAALVAPHGGIDVAVIDDIDELLSYYKEIFTILSACAGKQVEPVLFKRTTLTIPAIGEMAERSFRRQQKRAAQKGLIKIAHSEGLKIQGDRIFIQALLDNIISLYFEHNSGGGLQLDFDVSDGFVRFVFKDTAYRYREEEIPLLFYVDNVKYDTKTDTLLGAQYMICRQIIREHDAYSPRRGCRIYVENCEDGNGSRFIFTLPLA